jgi:hypothetical protein
MAISSYKIYLMYKASNSASWTKLIDIKDFGDLGGTPEMIETTTLSDPMQTFIKGIQMLQSDGLPFTCNYTLANYNAIKTLEDADSELDFAIWFGATTSGGVDTPSGADGKFEFKGKISVYVQGAGVNEVVNMLVTIVPSIKITQSAT